MTGFIYLEKLTELISTHIFHNTLKRIKIINYITVITHCYKYNTFYNLLPCPQFWMKKLTSLGYNTYNAVSKFGKNKTSLKTAPLNSRHIKMP